MKRILAIFLIICSFVALAKTPERPQKETEEVLLGSICKEPEVVFDFSMPPVKYTTNLTPKQFSRKNGEKECHKVQGREQCVRGLTVLPEVHLSLYTKNEMIDINDKTYLCIRQITIKTVYDPPRINVYLSNQYPKGSCEFNVLKKHEGYHVEVFKQSILFYNPQIKKSLIQLERKLRAISIGSQYEMESLADTYAQVLSMKFMKIQNYINSKINQKNAAIDTTESYAATQALCDNW